MAQFKSLLTEDVITVFGVVADHYSTRPDWERVYSEAEAAELKGEALDAALEDSGLPKSGKADEKRQRIAEHKPVTALVPDNPDTKEI